MNRAVLIPTIALTGVALLLSGCSSRPADREESFSTAAAECSASWWLEDAQDNVPEEAHAVARAALEDAKVSEEDLRRWEQLLRDSESEESRIPDDRLEGHAYVEAVRSAVRDELERAGYPDQDRLIEVTSQLNCD